MSDLTPPPIPHRTFPPRPVKIARSLWLLSFAVGLIAAFFIFLARDVQLGRLSDMLDGLEPGRDKDTLDLAAALVFWVGLGGFVLILLIEAILMQVMLRGHGGARWGLLVLLFVNAGMLVIVDALIVSPEDDGIYVRALLLAGLVSAAAGLIFSLVPRASAWFRAEHEARRRRA